jgi:hypothetical protein
MRPHRSGTYQFQIQCGGASGTYYFRGARLSSTLPPSNAREDALIQGPPSSAPADVAVMTQAAVAQRVRQLRQGHFYLSVGIRAGIVGCMGARACATGKERGEDWGVRSASAGQALAAAAAFSYF